MLPILPIVSLITAVPPDAAQDRAPPTIDQTATRDDIVVTGRRMPGSVIGDVAPVAVLDEAAIRALGASSMRQLVERLRPLTRSGADGDSALLLNGRRIATFDDIKDIPPDALRSMEILPEREASRFGFPPDVRVMNIITKPRYRGLTLNQTSTVTTQGGGGTSSASMSGLKIDRMRRLSGSLTYTRQNPLLQSQRAIPPDRNAPFGWTGNVTGIDGNPIDPRLDRLAQGPVTIAAVPRDPARRMDLMAYLAGANRPEVADVGRYRTLVSGGDTLQVAAALGLSVGRTLNGSLSIGIDATRGRGLNGPAGLALRVPGGGRDLPFADDVLLYRYLPGVTLRQDSTGLTLRGGATLQGGFGRWNWAATAALLRVDDRVRSQAAGGRDAPQAIAADANPFGIVRPDLATSWTRTLTGSASGTLLLNGPVAALPAGEARVTLTGDAAIATSRGSAHGTGDRASESTRGTQGIGAAFTFPIANERALSWLGTLSASAMVGVSHASGYGNLHRSSIGIDWTPAARVTLTSSLGTTQTAPDIAMLTQPPLATPNVPFFDFETGRSVPVTTITGGDPGLAAERRRTTSLGIALTPVANQPWQVRIDYIATRIRDRAIVPGSNARAFATAFPGRFVRNAGGAS